MVFPQGAGMSQYEKFWERFEDVVVEQVVPREKARWYVRWAKDFARSMRKPLVERTSDDDDLYTRAESAGIGSEESCGSVKAHDEAQGLEGRNSRERKMGLTHRRASF